MNLIVEFIFFKLFFNNIFIVRYLQIYIFKKNFLVDRLEGEEKLISFSFLIHLFSHLKYENSIPEDFWEILWKRKIDSSDKLSRLF